MTQIQKRNDWDGNNKEKPSRESLMRKKMRRKGEEEADTQTNMM